MIPSARLLAESEASSQQRLRLSVAALRYVDPGEVDAGGADLGMVRPSSLLLDRQRALIERLRLGIAALQTSYQGEVVEAGADVKVLGALRPFRVLQGPPQQRLGFWVTTLISIDAG